MTDLARTMSEEELLTAITEAATYRGWRWVHFRPAQTAKGWRTPTQGHSGFPDLCLVRKGDLLFWELKAARGSLSPDQVAWLDEINANRGGLCAPDQRAQPIFPADLDWALGRLK